jgi:hypothetical protein
MIKAKQKRLKTGAEPKKSQVKYENGKERVKNHDVWKTWDSLKSSANKTLQFNDQDFRKDVPSDRKMLMK